MTTINNDELDAVLRDFKNGALNQNDARAKIVDLTGADEPDDLPKEGETETTTEEVANKVAEEDDNTREANANGEEVEGPEPETLTSDQVAASVTDEQNEVVEQTEKAQEEAAQKSYEESKELSDGNAVVSSNKAGRKSRKGK